MEEKHDEIKDQSVNAHYTVTEKISKSVFSIPVHPGLAEEDLGKILEALEKVSNHYFKA